MYLMDGANRVLIIDRDAGTRELLEGLLDRGGLGTIAAADGGAGLKLFYSERPDLVLLALGLSDVPVLVLGDNGNGADEVRALRSGADDFLAKPFGRAEIQARIEALLRRPRQEDEPEFFEDDFVQVDHRRHEVRARGSMVELTPLEFRLLAAFARHPGQALTHAQLLALVWGEAERESGEVKLYVSYLRRKLKRAGVEPVETVRGIGYRYAPRATGPRRPPASG
jgi:two-component system KDP operon response regulator KdpE